MILDEQDDLNDVERHIRRLAAIAEMLSETGLTDAERMRAGFEELGFGLVRIADNLRAISHPEGQQA
jgi:hypothetical protein